MSDSEKLQIVAEIKSSTSVVCKSETVSKCLVEVKLYARSIIARKRMLVIPLAVLGMDDSK